MDSIGYSDIGLTETGCGSIAEERMATNEDTLMDAKKVDVLDIVDYQMKDRHGGEWATCSKEIYDQYSEYHVRFGGYCPVRKIYAYVEVDVFFASGQHGSEVRADGNGGRLPRGWYVNQDGFRRGPFQSRAIALNRIGAPA
jgi:hypothetical protein